MKGRKWTKPIVTALAAAFTALSFTALSACSSGRDGEDFSLYQTWLELREAGEFSGTFSEFVKEYLNPSVSLNEGSLSIAMNASLLNIVSIEVGCTYSYRSGFTSSTTTYQALGSGILWDVDRQNGNATIVTNCHVVYDSFDSSFTEDGITYTRTRDPLSYTMHLYGLESEAYAIPFSIVGYSVSNDVAVLKVENSDVIKNSLISAVTLGDSDKVAVGDDVYLVGNALGEGISVTRGVVSVESEETTVTDATETKTTTLRSIRTDAAANHGNSGGGLFDKDGKLLGVLFAGSEDANGIGDCLPISAVKGVVRGILRDCAGSAIKTKKVLLGLTTDRSQKEQVYDENGRVTVREKIVVTSSSSISNSLKSGDWIKKVKIGDVEKEITRSWHIADILWYAEAGKPIVFTVERNGEEKEITITPTSINFKTVE